MNKYSLSVVGWNSITIHADYFETEAPYLRFYVFNNRDGSNTLVASHNTLVALFPSYRSIITEIEYNI